MSYTNISWDEATADSITISDATITATGASSWDKKVKSTSTFDNSTTLKFTSWNTSGAFVGGFAKDPFAHTNPSAEYASVEYGFYVDVGNDYYEISESGSSSNGTSSAGITTTSIFKIERTSLGQFKYYVDDVLIKTTAAGDSSAMYAHGTFNLNGAHCTGSTQSSNVEQESTPIAGEGAPIDYILYLNTKVPK